MLYDHMTDEQRGGETEGRKGENTSSRPETTKEDKGRKMPKHKKNLKRIKKKKLKEKEAKQGREEEG